VLPVVVDAVLGRRIDLKGAATLPQWSSVALIGAVVAVLLSLHSLTGAPFIYSQF
jgi:hypothetical protein